MPIRFRCPRCNHGVKAAEKAVGRKMYCPTCYLELIVPAESTVHAHEEEERDIYGVDAAPIDVREMQDRNVASFPCPICRAMLAASPEQIGQKIECPDCGTQCVVPADIAAPPDPHDASQRPSGSPGTASTKPVGIYGLSGKDALLQSTSRSTDPFGNPLATPLPPAPPPPLPGANDATGGVNGGASVASPGFPVWCRLCGTIMYATEDQIGTMLTCPDCETQTLVRKREQTLDTGPHQAQRFEGGSTYEIADAPPSGTRLVPVVCSLCATRMYAPESEIGGTKICPDCGRANPIVDVPEKEKFVYEVPGGEYGISSESQEYKPPPIRAGVDYRLIEGSLDRENWAARQEQSTAGSLGFNRPAGEGNREASKDAGKSGDDRGGNDRSRSDSRRNLDPDPQDRIAWGSTPRIPEEYDRRNREAEIASEVRKENIPSESKREKERRKNPIPQYENIVAPLIARRNANAAPENTPTGRSVPVPPPLPAAHPVPPLPPSATESAAPVRKKKKNKRSRQLTDKERMLLRQGKRLLPKYPLVNGLLKPFLHLRIIGQISGVTTLALLSGLIWYGALLALQGAATIHPTFLIMFYLLMGLQLLCCSVWLGVLADQCVTLFTSTANGDDEWAESGEYEYATGTMLLFALLALNMAATIPAVPILLIFGTPLTSLVSEEARSAMQLDATAVSFVLQYFIVRIVHGLFFPPLFLAVMETGSFFNPFSTKVWATLLTAPLRWFRFYVLSFFVLILPEVCMIPLCFLSASALRLGIVATVLSVVFSLIALLYFRLLGRHAWTLTR